MKRVTSASANARPQVPRQLVFVPKGDLKARAINEKALTWDKVAKPGAPPAGEAAGDSGASPTPGVKPPAFFAASMVRPPRHGGSRRLSQSPSRAGT